MEPVSTPPSPADAEKIYGEAWAARYDDIFVAVDDEALDFLENLAGREKRALELAVGTGRVAIPLAKRGIAMTGIDNSKAMLDRLSAKPGGDRVASILGDMVTFPVDDAFPLVYIAFNSFFALSSQERQVECFASVSDHLELGGHFVLECFVPDMKRFDSDNRHESERSLGADGAVYSEISKHEPVSQTVDTVITTHYPDETESSLPVAIRYAWPSELDLMARLAGLELEDRFGWYDTSAFDHYSERHVSVYLKP